MTTQEALDAAEARLQAAYAWAKEAAMQHVKAAENQMAADRAVEVCYADMVRLRGEVEQQAARDAVDAWIARKGTP